MAGKKHNRVETLLKEHLTIIISLIVTYVFGIAFSIFSYYSNFDDYLPLFGNKEAYLMHTIFESIIPSTITFALTNFFQNIILMVKNSSDTPLYNILSMSITILFELIYCITALFNTNVVTIILNSIMLFLTVLFVVLAYKEMRESTNRKHSLTN